MKTCREDYFKFEIGFYERILEKSPKFPQALMALGDLYTKTGRFQEGLEVDQRLARLYPTNAEIFYNLACSYSLMNEVEKSFACIKRAVALGYYDFEYLQKDDDLKNLRCTEEFQRYFDELWLKQRGQQKRPTESLRIFKDQ
ncbi:MAG: hypothetical protein AB1650_02575 [Candidatus Omnitrophota bacterium]